MINSSSMNDCEATSIHNGRIELTQILCETDSCIIYFGWDNQESQHVIIKHYKLEPDSMPEIMRELELFGKNIENLPHTIIPLAQEPDNNYFVVLSGFQGNIVADNIQMGLNSFEAEHIFFKLHDTLQVLYQEYNLYFEHISSYTILYHQDTGDILMMNILDAEYTKVKHDDGVENKALIELMEIAIPWVSEQNINKVSFLWNDQDKQIINFYRKLTNAKEIEITNNNTHKTRALSNFEYLNHVLPEDVFIFDFDEDYPDSYS